MVHWVYWVCWVNSISQTKNVAEDILWKLIRRSTGSTTSGGLSIRIWRLRLSEDWVWGLGLIISGLFFALGVIRYGVTKFRKEFVNVIKSDIHIGSWFDYNLKFLIPIEAMILLIWWLYRSIGWNPADWFNPFIPESLGTCVVQWTSVILILILLNHIVYKKLVK